ncbi:hypothetical protein SHKM778_95440 (plasmid) [Streptomyces sp. KM77-8]|uniref:Uncharacterized protein n=1 Tax=Streptomyces haneummycinicus TaxID=3074435 RepID=A0AAT9I016_9ACTN
MGFGDQKRQGEAAQDAFGGSGPLGFAVLDLDEFTGEGKFFRSHTDSGGQVPAQVQQASRDAGALAVQAGDLPPDRFGRRGVGVAGHGELIEFLAGLLFVLGGLFTGEADLTGPFVERCRVVDRWQARPLEPALVLARPFAAAVPLAAELVDPGPQFHQPFASGTVDAAPEPLRGQPQSVQVLGALALFFGELPDAGVEVRAEVRQGVFAALGEEERNGVAAPGQERDLCLDGIAAIARLHDGRQVLDHLTGPHDLGVTGGQRVEVRDDLVDSRLGIEGFEHAFTDEIVEASDCLHRHGLVEQVEGLLAGDSEAAAQRLPVRG